LCEAAFSIASNWVGSATVDAYLFKSKLLPCIFHLAVLEFDVNGLEEVGLGGGQRAAFPTTRPGEERFAVDAPNPIRL
jgi:hypothetical protein